MPAIAPIEDLKAAQKDGVSIYAMLHALCAMRDIGKWLQNNGKGRVDKVQREQGFCEEVREECR